MFSSEENVPDYFLQPVKENTPGHFLQARQENVPGHLILRLDEYVPGHVLQAGKENVPGHFLKTQTSNIHRQSSLQAVLTGLENRLPPSVCVRVLAICGPLRPWGRGRLHEIIHL